MNNSWEKNVRTIEPYVPGEQPQDSNVIKLNTNENPYPPAKEVMESIKDIDGDMFRKYPDPLCSELTEALAEYHNLDKKNIFVGVGSDDVLGMSFLTFFNSDKPILFPDITYSFYPVWSDLFNVPFETKALDENFKIIPSDYYGENGGIVFPNPNAPTGILMPKEEIIGILENNKDVVVIVDEAYIDFAPEGSSCIDLIDRYPNLLVTRTYSKSRTLAGMRIGYAVGSEKLISYLNDVKFSYNSYTLTVATIKMGAASVKSDDYFKKVIASIIDTREYFSEEIKKLGFKVLPSSANFVFASHPDIKASYIYEEAKKRNIYVRYFNSPRIDNYLRITIGMKEDMDSLIEFLKELTSK